jgi:hypothetical protein
VAEACGQRWWLSGPGRNRAFVGNFVETTYFQRNFDQVFLQRWTTKLGTGMGDSGTS